MNSLYGAIGNAGFRFFNNYVAESITLTGQYALRLIEKDIDKSLNSKFKTDNWKYLIYIDTDSVQFEMAPVVNKFFKNDTIPMKVKKLEKIAIDILQDEVNKIVSSACTNMKVYENKLYFKLEAVGDKAVFLAKKRYSIRVHSSEGVTYAKPKYKVVGLDMVKSSTPQFIRGKLRGTLPLIFDSTESDVQKYLETTRAEFDTLPPDQIAFPRGVNGLEDYADAANVYKKGAGMSTPIHVRASLLYNSHIKKYNLQGKYPLITSGSKIRFLYLKLPNPSKENVIAFPADDTLPTEFGLDKYIDKDLQWDKTMIASTQNILDAINWSAIEQSSLDDFFS